MVKKVGIIGCGKIAEKHIIGYKTMGGIEIIVFDLDQTVAQETAARFGVASAKSIEELYDSAEVDIIDVCTPVDSHKDIILKALKKQKHVFCEKPLCLSLTEAYQIKGAAENAEKILMVGYLYRFHPAFQRVKEVLNEGIIGKPYFSLFRLGGRGSHRAWKHLKKDGGGAINEMMVHKLDLIAWFFGEITEMESLKDEIILPERTIAGKNIKADAEDFVLARLKADGVRIICESDLISPSYMNYIEIHGDNGSIFTSILHYMPTIVFCKQARGIYNQGNNFLQYEAINLFEKELRHFFNAIERTQRNMNSIDDSIKVLEIIEKIKA